MTRAYGRSGERRRITESLKRKLLLEAGYKCGNPACRNIIFLDVHHLVPVKKGGGNTEANLIALCALCHDLHHRGQIPGEHVQTWKLMLVRLNEAHMTHAIERLLFLASPTNLGSPPDGYPMYVSGDGVLTCADLITAGLVEAVFVHSSFGGGLWQQHFKLSLTARGEQLVGAWKAGAGMEAVKAALALPR